MDNGNNPINNWLEFQKSIIKQLPSATSFNNNGIEQYVQRAIKGYMHHSMPRQMNDEPFIADEKTDHKADHDYDLFDTQRTIFVRVKVPDKSFHQMKLWASAKILRIQTSRSSQEVNLPGDVIPDRATARTDGDVLEIQLPKAIDSSPFYQIMIREQI